MGDVIRFPRRNIRARQGLTRRQLQALQFIKAYRLASGGKWPTYDQIGEAINLRSRGGTVRTVSALFELGALERPEGPTR